MRKLFSVLVLSFLSCTAISGTVANAQVTGPPNDPCGPEGQLGCAIYSMGENCQAPLVQYTGCGDDAIPKPCLAPEPQSPEDPAYNPESVVWGHCYEAYFAQWMNLRDEYEKCMSTSTACGPGKPVTWKDCYGNTMEGYCNACVVTTCPCLITYNAGMAAAATAYLSCYTDPHNTYSAQIIAKLNADLEINLPTPW